MPETSPCARTVDNEVSANRDCVLKDMLKYVIK